MAKKLNEYDYLAISARIHALETKMLTRERMERMLDARTTEDAVKVLAECGYPEFSVASPATIEQALSHARLALFEDFRKSVPNPALVDVFCIKYDYHNAKTLLKAAAMDKDPSALLIDAGRYPAKALQENFDRDGLNRCSDLFRRSVSEARDVLATSGDPQAADLILDRAYYQEFLDAAQSVGSTFLEGYVRLSLDAANLGSLVRAKRMNRGTDFLKRVLMEGGTVSVSSLLALSNSDSDWTSPFPSQLKAAAEEAMSARKGGSLTAFERLCDNGVTYYLMEGKRVSFGEQPLLGYLYAKEAELTTIRIILTGRLANLDAQALRERLRESYG